MNSYKAEMLVDGQWSSNALRFRTKRAAELYAQDLFMRWTQPTDKRVVGSNDEPTFGNTTERWESEASREDPSKGPAETGQ